MSITPYVVRGIDIPSKSVITMWSGQEHNYSLEGPEFEKERIKKETTKAKEKSDGAAGVISIHAPENVKIGEKLDVF